MRIAIIGGAGIMGKWFTRFFSKDGHEVLVIDKDETKLREIKPEPGVTTSNASEAIGGADVVLISVLPGDFEQAIREICPYLRRKQIVADITSVKVQPMAAMHGYAKHGLVLGTHPMFGPHASDICNQNIVLTPTNNAEIALANRAKRYLEARGAHAPMMSPQEHDRMMAVVLGLGHFISLAAADTLLAYCNPQPGVHITSSTYKALLDMINSVISQNPGLTAWLQTNLPAMTEIRKLIVEKTKEWATLIENGSNEELALKVSILDAGLRKLGINS